MFLVVVEGTAALLVHLKYIAHKVAAHTENCSISPQILPTSDPSLSDAFIILLSLAVTGQCEPCELGPVIQFFLGLANQPSDALDIIATSQAALGFALINRDPNSDPWS